MMCKEGLMVYFKIQFLDFVGGTAEDPVSSIRVTDLRITDRIRVFPKYDVRHRLGKFK
jgi:hypothetical protein